MRKKLIVVIFCILAFGLLSFMITNNYNVQDSNKPYNLNLNSWLEPNFHLFINDTDSEYNWSKTVETYEWCNGSGTWSDPYIIDDVYFSRETDYFFIEIVNSSASFIISNCDMYREGFGPNSGGISLSSTTNGVIYGNNIISSFESIKLKYCSNIKIIDNILSHVSYYGIILEHSEDNLIVDNKIHSYYSFYSINSDNNNYSYNSITNNKIGAFFDVESDSNLLYHNSFTEDEFSGYFICHACDNGTSNQWDNGSIGNYWDDYKGQDLDDNGIGDTAYKISGETESVDHFPIWDDGPDNQFAIIYSFDIVIIVFVILILSGFSITKKLKYRNK